MKKIVTTIIVAIALIAMMGVASADPYNLRIYNAAGTAPAANPLDLQPGQSLTLSLYMESMVNDSDVFPILPAVVTPFSGGAVGDISVVYTTGTLTPAGSDPYVQVAEVNVTLAAAAPIGAYYNIQIGADGASPMDIGLASRNLNSIPEFPTIALPIAAILGLAFIFQRRREEE